MEENHSFFALMSRMKYIARWGLMRNAATENVSEHSLDTAMLAHLLAVLHNTRYGGSVSPERCALLAVYHDATEILTGDLPTPVKYYNAEIKSAYALVEENAREQLLSMLPADIADAYRPLFAHAPEDEQAHIFVKAADKLSALVKCVEERAAGNTDFLRAEEATLRAVKAMQLPEVEDFLREFLPAYSKTLDEQA
ncbi:MAG: 5'-deoxynucleotidase [Oscillospiraceae bacterium]